MLRTLIMPLLVLSGAAVSAMAWPSPTMLQEPTSSAASHQESGLLPFEPIFDGKTLDGWLSYTTGKTPENWGVEDGALVRLSDGGDIMTAAQYDHFELQLEWKISPEGNSGIMFRVKLNDGEPYFSGPEIQVLDDTGHGLDDRSNTGAGSLYGLVAAEGKVLHPTGEYNSIRLRLQGDHLEHWLNGKKVLDIELHSDRWNDLVQNSKFKEWPQFGMNPMGPIDFQDHGHQVWFRNIQLRPLPPPANEESVFADLSTSSAQALIHQQHGTGDLVVLDVRTPKEFENGHLDGVEHFDFYEGDFQSQLNQLDKDLTYLVYCRSGGRSGKTVTLMKDLGFHAAYSMVGGYDRWSAEKRPVAKLP